ncbi:MAG: hypothetical protein H6559_16210 [Lewinellaceae bacterium]|nr:hypothetical protein [Lewinellaceae bacterium]
MKALRFLKKVPAALCLVLILGNYPARSQPDTLRVLFVGNSFTYFHNLPQMVSAMAASQDVAIFTRQSTVGGSSLEQHWKGEKGTNTMARLEEADWDYVVLNNHSLSAIETPESFLEYGRKFAERIREKGARPVFMMTWAYKSNPLMQAKITEMYKRLAAETGSGYVPCGPLFAAARQWRPGLELFSDDKHPSPNGTYLLALAFYKYLSGKTVLGIPERLATKDLFGEKLYLVFMNEDDAKFLQQLTEEFDFRD